MKNVPHWQWLVVLYFVLVALPVYSIHSFLKKRAFANRTAANLVLYFVAVLSGAFILHSLTMWCYFTFFFRVKH